MLYEIECDLFAEKIEGEFVPRGPIRFHGGLNTVLGDKKAENAIGKSTFLLAIDFCFGGDGYVTPKINNAVNNVDSHVIRFAFKFGEHIEYYCRSTLTPSVVIPCDQNYLQIGDAIQIKDYREYLKQAYRLQVAQGSWRNTVGRYSRIYGLKNADEREPLKNGNEKVAQSIIALEQLFGVYDLIKEYKAAYDDVRKLKTIRKEAADIDLVIVASSKRQVKDNLKEIERLEYELQVLTNDEDSALADEEIENLDAAAAIKGQISLLKRRRSAFLSQLIAVNSNLEDGLAPTSDDVAELKEYFPDVNIRRLEQIENFHNKIHGILGQEMTEEAERLEVLIDNLTTQVHELEEEQRKLGVPSHISRKFLDETVRLRSRIDSLKKQNQGYEETKAIREEAKEAKVALENAREEQLKIIESTINQEMVRLNDYIYDGERYAPEIHFKSTRTGKPAYEFGCVSDTSTGDNYKNLIIYDISVLNNTDLPYLIHDSVVFKNIADLPIDRIVQLYSQSDKQIFIAFDKTGAYTDDTARTLRDTSVIELYDNGGELFGWSWAKKKK